MSLSFVGEYAGDCGLLERVVVGGSYIGGGELYELRQKRCELDGFKMSFFVNFE